MKQKGKRQWIPKRQPTPTTTGELKRHQCRWVPKALLKAQGFYEGNRHLWIPKDKAILRSPALTPTEAINKRIKFVWIPKIQTQQPNPQQKHLEPKSFAVEEKQPILPSPLSPPMSPTPTLIGSNSMSMEIESSQVTSDYTNTIDNMVLIFPPPSPKPTTTQEELKLKEPEPNEKTPSSFTSKRTSPLSQAAETLKRHFQPPRWWVHRFSQSQIVEISPQGMPKANIIKHPISVFLAEAEPEENLLDAFQHWIPYEEERAEYENIFFQQFWPQLPREIRNKIKVLVFTAQYNKRYPFGAINAPNLFQRAMADVFTSFQRRNREA